MKVSNCCGSPPKSNGDANTEDYGICASCGDYCEYVEEEELEEDEEIPFENIDL